MKSFNLFKILGLTLCILFVTNGLVIAQWSQTGDDIYYDDGYVGIGTTAPLALLQVGGDTDGEVVVVSDDGRKAVLKAEDGGNYLHVGSISSHDFQIVANNLVGIELSRYNGIKFYSFTDYTEKVRFKNNGDVGIGTTNPQGKLDVNGSIYQRGSQLHADYVFEPEYKLESIEEHAKFMWGNRHLKAIPKANVDESGQEIVEVGAHRKGIVEELEKAHIYIEGLNKQIKAMQEKMAALEAGLKTE